jgi:hypothetical protein
VTLQARLTKLNIRHKDLAFITGRTERAVHHWVYEIRPLPRCADLLLTALEDGLIGEEWLARELSKHIPKNAKFENRPKTET